MAALLVLLILAPLLDASACLWQAVNEDSQRVYLNLTCVKFDKIVMPYTSGSTNYNMDWRCA